MKKYKVGIVGCGGIMQYSHLPAILALSDELEIVAVSDIVEKRMYKEGIPKDAKRYLNYEDLVNDPEIDIIDICTPNYLHAPIAVAGLNAGKNVMCEKPEATTAKEMESIMNAEKASGKRFMALRNCRKYDVSEFLADYVGAGKCGELYSGKCGYLRRRGIPGKGGWFTDSKKSGGGPLVDLGVHMLDFAIFMMGHPKAHSVSCCTYSKFADTDLSDSDNSKFGDKVENGVYDVEDMATGFIRFEDGRSLQFEFCWAANLEKETSYVQLYGTKSGFSFSFHDIDKNEIYTEECGELVNVKPSSVVFKSGHGKCFRNLVDVLNGKAEPYYTTEQGMNVVKILEASYVSAREGREVLL